MHPVERFSQAVIGMRSAAVAAGAVGFIALDRVSGVALELVGLETTPPAVLTIIDQIGDAKRNFKDSNFAG